MNASKLRHLAAALAALSLAALAAPAAAAQWQDNAIGYRWGATFREPGVVDADGKAKDVAKSILSFTHVDGYELGGNFLGIDYLISNDADPSVGGAQGAAELYAVYRTDLSLNKVTGTETFKFGPIRDLSLQAGVDLNTKNTSFASRKIMPVLGAVVAFEVPGFLNVGLLGAREFNQNGVVHKQVTFDPTLIVSTSWGIPIGPATFGGFGNLILPKGKDGFGAETKTELLLHPKLLLDVGQFWGWKKAVEVGVGYEYWLNKFGNDHDKVKGSLANTPFVELALHL